MTRPLVALFALLTILVLLLAGCGGDLDPSPTPVPTPANTATTAPPPPSPTSTTLPPTATEMPPTKTPAPTATAANPLLALAPTMDVATANTLDSVSSCATQWHVVGTQPDPGGKTVAFIRGIGVAALAEDDVWLAVTTGESDTTGANTAVFDHWDGQTWTVTPLDQPGRLDGIAAASPTELWAVGGNYPAPPLLLRGDGKSWTPVDLSALDDADLVSVAAIPGQAWAVGGKKNGVPLALHWDGTQWADQSPQLPTGMDGGVLYSVTMLPDGEAWAAGRSFIDHTVSPLILHWDGQNWAEDKLVLGAESWVNSIAVLPSNTVWVAGFYKNGPMILQRDAQGQWIPQDLRAAFRAARLTTARLMAVDAVADDDVWVVGMAPDEQAQLTVALALHWDGEGWTIVQADKPGSTANQFSAIDVSPDGEVWAAGPMAGSKWSIMAQRFDGNCATTP